MDKDQIAAELQQKTDDEKIDLPSIKVKPTGDLNADIREYCDLFQVPLDSFLKIISDQKVVPMIRGKAIEFATYDFLLKHLDDKVWEVIKDNMNAQPGTPDEDVKIKHIESGEYIKIEVKSAVRSSFHVGSNATIVKKPHFKVKCHRSRSQFDNDKLNDRYLTTDFDLLVTSPSNSLVLSGEEFHIVNTVEQLKILSNYYDDTDALTIFKESCKDIRVVRPDSISEQYLGYNIVPRTPTVKLDADPNWIDLSMVETLLDEIIAERKR